GPASPPVRWPLLALELRDRCRRPSRYGPSGQAPVDLGQEAGEVQAVRAGRAGGVEGGAGPVAGRGRPGGVMASGPGRRAVVRVVRQEPGQVAQLGAGPGGQRAAAVAVGAKGLAVGDRRVAELAEGDLVDRLEPSGGVDVLAELVGVSHRDTAATDPLVRPDRVQKSLE